MIWDLLLGAGGIAVFGVALTLVWKAAGVGITFERLDTPVFNHSVLPTLQAWLKTLQADDRGEERGETWQTNIVRLAVEEITELQRRISEYEK